VNYYERNLGDYARDAGHLSLLEHGVYTLLLDRYYHTEAGIPESETYRLSRARTDEEKAAVDSVLREFFRLVDGVWVKARVEAEIEKTRQRIEAAKENGKRGGRPKKPNRNPAETQPFQSGSENKTQPKALHTPDPIHQSVEQERKGGKPPALALPDWLPPDVWQDWHTFRNGRKGWTPKARELSLRTLTTLYAAGHDPRVIVERSIEMGWTGLFPPKGDARAGPGAAPMGKTMTGIMALEAMKNGLADSGSGDRNPAALVSEPRRLPGR
jgi:uncharacterized protein YdaU (DUF1376 family)